MQRYLDCIVGEVQRSGSRLLPRLRGLGLQGIGELTTPFSQSDLNRLGDL